MNVASSNPVLSQASRVLTQFSGNANIQRASSQTAQPTDTLNIRFGSNFDEARVTKNLALEYAIKGYGKSSDLEKIKRVLQPVIESKQINDLGSHGKGGRAPLHLAVLHADINVVKLLLENGADPNLKDTSLDQSPLYLAAQQGSMDVVQVLLEYGADINSSNETIERFTPLMAATYANHTEVAEYLRQKGGH